MSRHYAIFAIGPVQSFIAASRKLEDLWGGSYLLSFLIKQTITNLEDTCRVKGIAYKLIYPHYNEDEGQDTAALAVANYPNRITFILDATASLSKEVMIELESRVRNELKRIADWAVKHVFEGHDAESNKRVAMLQKQAREQMDQFLEVNWIAYPIEEGHLEYRIQAEKQFHALKSQRPMQYAPETGIACTVYQRMDALCYELPKLTDSYARLNKKLLDTWSKRKHIFKPASKKEQDKARIRDNEFLCGISLVRRVARDFFQAEYGYGTEVFSKYESVVNLSEDDNYFALLLMDGDNMGQFFNGGEQEVSHTSEKLSRFATQLVPGIVKRHAGVLLYAGGDDVLALFPVKSVLQAAYDLRMAFSDEEHGLKGATASTGIAIGHQRTPLQQMLNQARTLEKAAKAHKGINADKPEKNAFALSVLPRSGEFLGPLVLPWEKEKRLLTNELSVFVDHLSKVVSTTFIYQFAASFQGMIPAKTQGQDEPAFMAEMVQQEYGRLIKRSLLDKNILGEMGKEIPDIKIYYELLKLEGLIDMLKILAFFNRRES